MCARNNYFFTFVHFDVASSDSSTSVAITKYPILEKSNLISEGRFKYLPLILSTALSSKCAEIVVLVAFGEAFQHQPAVNGLLSVPSIKQRSTC